MMPFVTKLPGIICNEDLEGGLDTGEQEPELSREE